MNSIEQQPDSWIELINTFHTETHPVVHLSNGIPIVLMSEPQHEPISLYKCRACESSIQTLLRYRTIDGLPESFNTPVTETTKYPFIVQLSWIVYDTTTLTVERIQDHIIKCGVKIPLEATNIHGISTQLSETKGININVAMDLFDIDLNLAI